MIHVLKCWTIRAGSRLPELAAGACLVLGLVVCVAILGNGRNDSAAMKPALDKPAINKPAVKPGVVAKPSANAVGGGATASTAL